MRFNHNNYIPSRKTGTKNHVSKMLIAVLASITLLIAMPTVAMAASETHDGIKAELTTDKSSYDAGDTVDMTIKVTNTNSFDVSNVKAELTLPNGLKLKSGETSVVFQSLATGETKEIAVSATATKSSDLPQTGEDSDIFIWIGLLCASLGALIMLLFFAHKKSKALKLFSLLLCCLLVLSAFAPAAPALAASVKKSFSISEAITVDGDSKTIKLNVSYDWEDTVPVAGVTVAPATASLTVGGTQQLTATIAPADATNKAISWESSDTAIAIVSDTGLVTAKAVGSTTITVKTTDGGKTGTSAITVTAVPPVPAVTSVTITPSTVSTEEGTAIVNQQLTANVTATGGAAQSVTWSVFSEGATGAGKVTVTNDGKLNVAADASIGTAVIRATSTFDSSKYGECTVNINPALIGATGVSLDKNTITGWDMDSTPTQQLTATVAPPNATNKAVTWESSDETVATVADGVVTAVGTGNTTITVKTADGNHTDTCTVAIGSKTASNAEAAKITAFTTGTNTTSTLVFNPTITGGSLTTGTTIQFVNTSISLGGSMNASGTLSLNTQNVVDAADLSGVTVTFTATLNGVVSDPVTPMDISGLFGATTTAGKLRTGNAMIPFPEYGAINFSGKNTNQYYALSPDTVLPPGVSIPVAYSEAFEGNPTNQFSIKADAGSSIMAAVETMPSYNGTAIFMNVKLSCDGTSYTLSNLRNIQVRIY